MQDSRRLQAHSAPDIVWSAQRIWVVGTCGSGKSTFANRLAGILGLPHVELDRLHWLPNWQARPPEEFRALLAEAVDAEKWILDGNYKLVRDLVVQRAHVVIWLNYSLSFVLRRLFSRSIKRLVKRETVCGENRESFRQTFLSRESVLLWAVTSHGPLRSDYRVLFGPQSSHHAKLLEFTRSLTVEKFLQAVAKLRQRY